MIVLGSFQAVVDTGANENKLAGCLSEAVPFWDKRIEVVFLSHSDKDHVKALTGIQSRYSIGRVVDKPSAGDVVRYESLSFDILKGSNLVVEKVMAGESETNESSVVMRLAYGNFSVLFTGDIDITSELALVERSMLTKTDVLKVSHHGSKYGSAREFLEKVSPGLAIISVAAKNSYGHPAGDTLGRILAVGAKVLRTDTNGSIFVETDGKDTKVFTQR